MPLDICSEDERRQAEGVEQLDGDIDDEIASWEDALRNAADRYTPASFWDDQTYYVEVAVEKVDLKNLFRPVCEEFYTPFFNLGGWADLWARANALVRFYRHHQQGRQGVLLACCDHDPGGLNITDNLRSNLHDMAGAVARVLGLDQQEIEALVDGLIIVRFGLNADFIDRELGDVWLDNLETGSGKRLDNPNLHIGLFVIAMVHRILHKRASPPMWDFLHITLRPGSEY